MSFFLRIAVKTWWFKIFEIFFYSKIRIELSLNSIHVIGVTLSTDLRYLLRHTVAELKTLGIGNQNGEVRDLKFIEFCVFNKASV